jgi:acyl-CoA thioesterase FadM
MKQFLSTLDASSYQAPGGGELYAPLRKNIVETAVAMGYDRATMLEYGVNWSDDQDPFGHVKNHAYGHFTSACNVRVFHSFEAQLKDKFEDMMTARGIGLLVRSTTSRLMRPVKFPDSVRADSLLDLSQIKRITTNVVS